MGTVQKRISPGKGVGICAQGNYRSLLWQVQRDSWGHRAGVVAGKEMTPDSRPAVGSGLRLFTGRHWRRAPITLGLWKLAGGETERTQGGSPRWEPVLEASVAGQRRVELQADTSRGGMEVRNGALTRRARQMGGACH